MAAMFRFVASFLILAEALGATPQQYEAWFRSSDGLSLSAGDAATLAKNEASSLDVCGVTVPALQELRNVLYLKTSLGLSMVDVRAKLLPLAYQHVNATKLSEFFAVLSGNWWTAGGLSLPVADSQSRAVELAQMRAEPEQLRSLYLMFYGYTGLQLPQRDAQVAAIEQTAAGSDAAAFQQAYLALQKAGKSAAECMAEAKRKGVAGNLQGVARRYAKDTQPYTAEEFQKFYAGDLWFAEWMAGPVEQRVDKNDQHEYTAASFKEYYGSSWITTWANSKIATQVRLSADRKPYTMVEFQQYYKETWQKVWASAPETRCAECGPYAVKEMEQKEVSAEMLV